MTSITQQTPEPGAGRRHVGIILHPAREEAVDVAVQFVQGMFDHGIACLGLGERITDLRQRLPGIEIQQASNASLAEAELMVVFGGDGTMHQANPDAGDPRTSDSDGKGVWEARGTEVRGKWVEVMADRTTHQFVGRLEITMQITVTGDSLRATEVVAMFDSTGTSVPVPATPKTLTGTRVTAR